LSEQERLRFPRFPGGTLFNRTGPDGEIRVASVDQGPGGAFLETTEPVRPGSVLVLTVHDPFERDQPVFLLARVMHCREIPQVGIGILWRKAISAFGVYRLRTFLDQHFHLLIDPHKTGAWAESELKGPVVYDFEAGSVDPILPEKLAELEEAEAFYGIKFAQGFLPKAQYLEVKMVPAGEEAARSKGLRRELAMDAAAMLRMDRFGPGEVITQPISLEEATSQCLTQDEESRWKQDMKKRKPARIPASVAVRGEVTEGMVRLVGEEGLLVVLERTRPEVGDRILIEMALTVGVRSGPVLIVGKAARIARDRVSKKVVLDVAVESVDEKGNVGLFRQCILAL